MGRKHSQKNAKYMRDRRERLRKEGKCTWCAKPAPPYPDDPTKLQPVCEACREKKNKVTRERHAKLYQLHKKLGICVVCGKRQSIKATCPGETDLRCAVCYEYQTEYKETHREEANAKRRKPKGLDHAA